MLHVLKETSNIVGINYQLNQLFASVHQWPSCTFWRTLRNNILLLHEAKVVAKTSVVAVLLGTGSCIHWDIAEIFRNHLERLTSYYNCDFPVLYEHRSWSSSFFWAMLKGWTWQPTLGSPLRPHPQSHRLHVSRFCKCLSLPNNHPSNSRLLMKSECGALPNRSADCMTGWRQLNTNTLIFYNTLLYLL